MPAPFDLARLDPYERRLWDEYCTGPSEDTDLIRVHSFAYICMLETGVPEVVSEYLAEHDPGNLVGQYHENVRAAVAKRERSPCGRLRRRLLDYHMRFVFYRHDLRRWRAKWTREAVAAKLKGWARQIPRWAFAALKWTAQMVWAAFSTAAAFVIGPVLLLAFLVWAMGRGLRELANTPRGERLDLVLGPPISGQAGPLPGEGWSVLFGFVLLCLIFGAIWLLAGAI